MNNTVKPEKKDGICENLCDSIAECHCQFPWLLFGFTFVVKLRDFDFESH